MAKKNYNVSKEVPLVTFAKLISSLALGIVALVISFSLIAQYILIPNIPIDMEYKLFGSKKYVDAIYSSEDKYQQENLRLNLILKKLEQHLPPEYKDIRFYAVIEDDNIANAYAALGGYIIFTDKLYELLKEDESQLAYILGHELGHFINRDHLKNIVGLVPVQIVLALLLGDSQISNHIATTTELHQSRDIEYHADDFGMQLMTKAGYSPASAIQALNKISTPLDVIHLAEYFSTHPNINNRIKRIQAKY